MANSSPDMMQHRAVLARVMALAEWELVRDLTAALANEKHDVLRGPETGLVMLRGRMGASGGPFNFGEATATRCSVRLPDNTQGHAYVLGRNGDRARRMALCDALLQRGDAEFALLNDIIARLAAAIGLKRQQLAAQVAATKVDFFTLVRGDG